METNAGGPTYTLDEALTAIGFNRYHWFALLYAGIASLFESMEMVVLSFIGIGIQPEWKLSNNQVNLVSLLTFVGMVFGAYLWGFLSDSFGRRIGIFGAPTLAFVVGLSSTFASSYSDFLMFRFITGVGLGGGHVFSTWFMEFLPTPIRGRMMIVFYGFAALGTTLEALLVWWILPRYGWRWLLRASLVPYLMVMLLFLGVKESSRFYYRKADTYLDKSERVIQAVAAMGQTVLPQGRLSFRSTGVHGNQSQSMTCETENQPPNTRISNKVTTLFSGQWITTTVVLWVLYLANVFSYYGVIVMTIRLRIGAPISQPQAQKHDHPNFYVTVMLTSIGEIIGFILAAVLTSIGVSRKRSMEVMFASGFIIFLPLLVNNHRVLAMYLVIGARMFLSAGFIIVQIYAQEVYPTELRARGCGIAWVIGGIGGMVWPFIGEWISGHHFPILVTIIFLLKIGLSGLLVWVLPYETIARDLDQPVEQTAEVELSTTNPNPNS